MVFVTSVRPAGNMILDRIMGIHACNGSAGFAEETGYLQEILVEGFSGALALTE